MQCFEFLLMQPETVPYCQNYVWDDSLLFIFVKSVHYKVVFLWDVYLTTWLRSGWLTGLKFIGENFSFLYHFYFHDCIFMIFSNTYSRNIELIVESVDSRWFYPNWTAILYFAYVSSHGKWRVMESLLKTKWQGEGV